MTASMSTTPTSFSFPTTIRYGAGTLKELPERLAKLGVTRALVVTDPGLPPTPAFALLRAALGEAGEGSAWRVFTGVKPNPE